jgi:hypothetical protein
LPALQKLKSTKGAVRRARIFYFRQLTGKKAKLKTKEDSYLFIIKVTMLGLFLKATDNNHNLI